jgi:hypothetical protein
VTRVLLVVDGEGWTVRRQIGDMGIEERWHRRSRGQILDRPHHSRTLQRSRDGTAGARPGCFLGL